MSKEAMKLALEALKELVAQTDGSLFAVKHDHFALQNARQAITALQKALANEALDKMADNARELGLDYEPARDSGIVTAGGADPRTQRTWVGLTDEERKRVRNTVGFNQFVTAGEYAEHVQKATEAKLKEKNNG